MGYCYEQTPGIYYQHFFSLNNKKSSSIILLSKTTLCKISAPLEKKGGGHIHTYSQQNLKQFCDKWRKKTVPW